MNKSGGKIRNITDTTGTVATLEYGGNGDLVRIVDADSNALEYEYDDHRMVKETLRNGTSYTAYYSPTDDRRVLYDSNSNAIAEVFSTSGFPAVRGPKAPAGIVEYPDIS